MIQLILNLVGIYLIWTCISWKRNKESEIEHLSKDFWLVFMMIVVAVVLLQLNL